MTDAAWSKFAATDLEYIEFIFRDTVREVTKAAAIYAAALGLYWALV